MAAKKFSFWFTPILYLTGILILIGSINAIRYFSGTKPNNNDSFYRQPSHLNPVFIIPENVVFAGETVPVNNYDTRESLDRELIVNAYFHSRTFFLLKRSNRYFKVIEPILKRYGIPDDFKYLAMAESGLENVVSPARATGIWQLMEATAREYGLEVNTVVDERYHLEKATEAACKYLLESYRKYGNWTMAAASYNAGRTSMDSQIERQQTANYYDLLLNDETARYIFRVLAHKLITEDPTTYGFNLQKEDYYPVLSTRTVKISESIDNLTEFARNNNINYKILKDFNPWLRQNYLNVVNGKTYEIIIPDPGQRTISW